MVASFGGVGIKQQRSSDAGRGTLIRYPGGKWRQVPYLLAFLPNPNSITGEFVEPFFGGGSVYFAVQPRRAVLADINPELIDLFKGIRRSPRKVWTKYAGYQSTKSAYYEVRSQSPASLSVIDRAARSLFLNRTCFKGMWRHNKEGQFNVGYGGQDRRWVISEQALLAAAHQLRSKELFVADFEDVIDNARRGDFLFLDPPYRPGYSSMGPNHYRFSRFSVIDQIRLAEALERASIRGIKWALMNSAHPDILSLYEGHNLVTLAKGTTARPGIIAADSKEVLITNYKCKKT